jgi:hypothetical protein
MGSRGLSFPAFLGVSAAQQTPFALIFQYYLCGIPEISKS